MKNPSILLRERCGINQKDFAEKYDFHKTTMVYWDAGMYPEISDRMNGSLALECMEKGVDASGELLVAYGEKTLAGAYAKWQSTTRWENRELFMVAPTKGTKTATPFMRYILSTTGSQQSFCKKLLVPAASVMRYAKGQTASMPDVIEDALTEIKYPWVSELVKLQENH